MSALSFKPGYKTTEFYVTMLAQALAALGLGLSDSCATEIASLVVSAVSGIAYTWLRTSAKR